MVLSSLVMAFFPWALTNLGNCTYSSQSSVRVPLPLSSPTVRSSSLKLLNPISLLGLNARLLTEFVPRSTEFRAFHFSLPSSSPIIWSRDSSLILRSRPRMVLLSSPSSSGSTVPIFARALRRFCCQEFLLEISANCLGTRTLFPPEAIQPRPPASTPPAPISTSASVARSPREPPSHSGFAV